jgi:hypothetical protein
VDGDIQDDAVWRRFQARNVASQTLSLQRAGWYAKSVRPHVMWTFWLTLGSAIVGLILLAVLVAAGTGDSSTSSIWRLDDRFQGWSLPAAFPRERRQAGGLDRVPAGTLGGGGGVA